MYLMIDHIFTVIISIGKAQLLVLGLIMLSYTIEKTTILNLFIDNYTWEKNPDHVEEIVARDSFIYMILCGTVFIYDIIKGNIALKFMTIVSWLVIMAIIVPNLYKLHRKYQGIDPDKPYDDWTSDME